MSEDLVSARVRGECDQHQNLHEGEAIREALDDRRPGRFGFAMLERLPVLATLLMMSGCPSEFGKDGRIDQAVEQDLKVDPSDCPPGQHRRRPELGCSGPGCRDCVDDVEDGGR